MGWTVDALWAAPRVSLGFPHIWSDRRRSRFRGSAFHRRCCLPAYQMWDLNLRRNALSGLQNGRRGPSRRFSVERDRDCRKPGEIADLTLSSGRGPGRVSPQVSITSWRCAKIRLSSRDVESGQLLGSEARTGRNNPHWNQHPGTVAHQPSGRTPTAEGLHREDGDQVSHGSEDQHVGQKRETRELTSHLKTRELLGAAPESRKPHRVVIRCGSEEKMNAPAVMSCRMRLGGR